MLGGYMGRMLDVDLSTGRIRTTALDEALARDYIGGYGIGARLLFEGIPPTIDPLGPENILAFLTGPLTGSPAPTGTRWTVAGKSPLTGTWGDANASGFFGVALKQAGFDGVLFRGISARPVFLYMDSGDAELRDASELWGKDCSETEDWAKRELGRDVEAACIGPAGEAVSLISAIIHYKGRAAGRSGLGALMGSKRLKMVAARGTEVVPVFDADRAARLRSKYVKQITSGTGSAEFYTGTGTPGYTPIGITNGDSPTLNWRESVLSLPSGDVLTFEELLTYRTKREACWRCPIACWGLSQVEYDGRTVVAHQPEYETASAFGSLTGNVDYPSIIAANDLCNRYGLDSISAGACVAFAMECYEKGLIDAEDTDGIEITWGNHEAMISVLEKMARREGIGDLLADGVKIAAERIGDSAREFAIHVGGQELPMHDPRYDPIMGLIYQIDATPGRHTQASNWLWPDGFEPGVSKLGEAAEDEPGRGRALRQVGALTHTMNASGICLFGFLSTRVEMLPEFLTAVTGHEYSLDALLLVGERIANLRQAFNVREGWNAARLPIPRRAYGRPPLETGPTRGVTVDLDQLRSEYLQEMGWSVDRAIPTRETLDRLGLSDIVEALSDPA